MKKILLTGVALSAMMASAVAADLPTRAPVAYKSAPPPVVFNWTGCYVGGQIGGQWSSWTGEVAYNDGVNAVAGSRSFDGKGAFIGGGQVGCNYQPFGSMFVVGVDADVVGTSGNSFSGEVYRFPLAPTDHFDATGKIGTQSAVRLRVGAAWDRALFYVAGGISWAQLSASHAVVVDGVGTALFENSKTQTGWNVGVGVEYAFAGNWTAGLEYRYTNYGSVSWAVPGAAFPAVFVAHTATASDIATNDVRIRLNYLFGGPGAGRY